MKIRELIEGLPVRLAHGSGDAAISDIVEDSREAAPGSLFVARCGEHADGRRFIGDAVARGAAAVLTNDLAAAGPESCANALLAVEVPLVQALIAERFWRSPSADLNLVGVTGTNGKTTTTHLIHQLLNNAAGGQFRCGLIGTVQIDDGAEVTTARFTTPPAIDLSRTLRRMVDHGCRACVMEASSHAIHQQRTAGLRFVGGVFTNLTGDHLDYHGSMENYAAAKAALFAALDPSGFAVINMDDPRAGQMMDASRAPVISCSLSDSRAACRARILDQSVTHVDVEMNGPWGAFEVRLPLAGRHNVINALQSAAVCHALGLDAASIREGLSRCVAPPGRLEPVTKSGDERTVLVDYAHTDDALENVLKSLRSFVSPPARLHVVFGCGGDRDRTKRPRMAAVAARYADAIVVTSDNPRTEDPQAIIDEILTGMPRDREELVQVEVDRERAIHTAIEQAGAGDVVLIAGKGHEDYQIIGRSRRAFDDRAVARAALARHQIRGSQKVGTR